jgi:hypothetical protein
MGRTRLGLVRKYQRVPTFTCADCGEGLQPSEKGQECPGCKRWPLCDKCKGEHDKGSHRSHSRLQH